MLKGILLIFSSSFHDVKILAFNEFNLLLYVLLLSVNGILHIEPKVLYPIMLFIQIALK